MDEFAQSWKDIDVSTPKDLRRLDQIISLATGGTGNCVNCFYSTDVNQALELLESVSDDYTPRLVRILQPTDKGKYEWWWKCAIMSNVGVENFEAYEATAALAICKAWLTYCDEVPY